MKTWGIAGSAGMASQVKALASVIGVTPEMKQFKLRPPFAWIPNLCYPNSLDGLVIPYALAKGSDKLTPPWPELVISCGRRGAIVALGLKAKIGDGARFIHIQDPHIPSSHFDVVVAMEHDRIQGPNVIKTRFALHTITPATLEEAKRFAPLFAPYAKPYTAVLLGGSTNKYTLSESGMHQVIASLENLLEHTPGSLLITASRRTGDRNLAMLKAAFGNHPRAYLYDGVSENPYLGMLALSDAIVVTNDSVNMMSEAHATGKPIYILPLPGHKDTKPARFADALIYEGIARVIGERVGSWEYAPSQEMERVALELKRRLLSLV